MQNKYLLKYPEHPEFEELLNSCGSMTKQLEALGQSLTVELLHEGFESDHFRRYTILKLNGLPVVAACSSSHRFDTFFTDLLHNASTTPIGKFLFANGSNVVRDKIEITLLNQIEITKPYLKEFVQGRYQHNQQFWDRLSYFHYNNQQMELNEIILPEIEIFL